MAKEVDYNHLTICHQEAISVLVSEIGALTHRVAEIESLCEQQGTILKKLLAANVACTDTKLPQPATPPQ